MSEAAEGISAHPKDGLAREVSVFTERHISETKNPSWNVICKDT